MLPLQTLGYVESRVQDLLKSRKIFSFTYEGEIKISALKAITAMHRELCKRARCKALQVVKYTPRNLIEKDSYATKT